jgi:heme-degrading monooxygenase HmoA
VEQARAPDAPMIYNTEIFEVSDINEFKRALESLRGAMSEAGGTELRIYRCVDNPTKVLAAMYWPDAASCRAFARDYEAEVEYTLRPALTSHQPEDLWEEI